MSTDLDMFVDTFQDLDFEDSKLKKTTAKKTETKSLAKETIKKIAEESDFHSRQKETPKKEKSKTYNKTFSLFQDECQVINNIIRAYYDAFEEIYHVHLGQMWCVLHCMNFLRSPLKNNSLS